MNNRTITLPNGESCTRLTFASISDLFRSIRNAPHDNVEHIPHYESSDFIGRSDLPNLDSVEDAAFTATPEDAQSAQEWADRMRSSIGTMVPDFRNRMSWSETNGRVRPSRLLEGASAYRRRRVKNRSAPPSLTLYASPDGLANIRPESFRIQAGAIAGLASILEARGVRVRIVGFVGFRNGWRPTSGEPNNVISTVVLKDYATRVNLTTTTASLTGWFFRTAWFCSLGTNPSEGTWAGGLGGQFGRDQLTLDVLGSNEPSDEVFFIPSKLMRDPASTEAACLAECERIADSLSNRGRN